MRGTKDQKRLLFLATLAGVFTMPKNTNKLTLSKGDTTGAKLVLLSLREKNE